MRLPFNTICAPSQRPVSIYGTTQVETSFLGSCDRQRNPGVVQINALIEHFRYHDAWLAGEMDQRQPRRRAEDSA